MAEQLAELNKSEGEWKYYNQVTGTTVINLPSTFKELFVKVVGTLAGGNKRIYHLNFIYDALSDAMSASDFYTTGFGLTGSGLGNTYTTLHCGKDKIQTTEFYDNGSNILSTAVTTVYYR